jgi:hypothetical protein
MSIRNASSPSTSLWYANETLTWQNPNLPRGSGEQPAHAACDWAPWVTCSGLQHDTRRVAWVHCHHQRGKQEIGLLMALVVTTPQPDEQETTTVRPHPDEPVPVSASESCKSIAGTSSVTSGDVGRSSFGSSGALSHCALVLCPTQGAASHSHDIRAE